MSNPTHRGISNKAFPWHVKQLGNGFIVCRWEGDYDVIPFGLDVERANQYANEMNLKDYGLTSADLGVAS